MYVAPQVHSSCLVCTCVQALVFVLKKSPWNFKVGPWKVLEKSLKSPWIFGLKKVYKPCLQLVFYYKHCDLYCWNYVHHINVLRWDQRLRWFVRMCRVYFFRLIWHSVFICFIIKSPYIWLHSVASCWKNRRGLIIRHHFMFRLASIFRRFIVRELWVELFFGCFKCVWGSFNPPYIQ